MVNETGRVSILVIYTYKGSLNLLVIHVITPNISSQT